MKQYVATVRIKATDWDGDYSDNFSNAFDVYTEAANEHSNELKIDDFEVIEEECTYDSDEEEDE